MALNKVTLGAALKSAMDGLATPIDRDAMFEAFAQAVIDHITANAVVSTTVDTTGTASAQTGTGTGTIS